MPRRSAPESPEGRANAALLAEAERIIAAQRRGEMGLEAMRAALGRCTPVTSAPEALPIRAALAGLVDRAVRGELAFPEFAAEYMRLYYEELPPWGLAWVEEEPLSEIGERLQWAVADEPTSEERALGWRTQGEFLDWLRQFWPRSAASGQA